MPNRQNIFEYPEEYGWNVKGVEAAVGVKDASVKCQKCKDTGVEWSPMPTHPHLGQQWPCSECRVIVSKAEASAAYVALMRFVLWAGVRRVGEKSNLELSLHTALVPMDPMTRDSWIRHLGTAAAAQVHVLVRFLELCTKATEKA